MSQATAPARLLLVEDDPDILFGVQVALEGEGYAVTSTESLPGRLAERDTTRTASQTEACPPDLHHRAVLCRLECPRLESGGTLLYA